MTVEELEPKGSTDETREGVGEKTNRVLYQIFYGVLIFVYDVTFHFLESSLILCQEEKGELKPMIYT